LQTIVVADWPSERHLRNAARLLSNSFVLQQPNALRTST
jgi:hypothetical protein